MQTARLGKITWEEIFGESINVSSRGLLRARELVIDKLKSCGAAYLTKFPVDPIAFVEFLKGFGNPLPNYSAGEVLPAYQVHPCLNRVRFEPRKGDNLRIHEKGGNLPPHSARSWSSPRPRYFAMLMCNPGWIDHEPGTNGESIVVPWVKVFHWMRDRDPLAFKRYFDQLTQTPIAFHANNVKEAISELPLVYPLEDSREPLDQGVRLKSDFLVHLAKYRLQIKQFDAFQEAVGNFWEAANGSEVRACRQMMAGELTLIDNNRFGHGRMSLISSWDNGTLHNPRELWSVALS